MLIMSLDLQLITIWPWSIFIFRHLLKFPLYIVFLYYMIIVYSLSRWWVLCIVLPSQYLCLMLNELTSAFRCEDWNCVLKGLVFELHEKSITDYLVDVAFVWHTFFLKCNSLPDWFLHWIPLNFYYIFCEKINQKFHLYAHSTNSYWTSARLLISRHLF